MYVNEVLLNQLEDINKITCLQDFLNLQTIVDGMKPCQGVDNQTPKKQAIKIVISTLYTPFSN